jgi:ATP-dependent helicase HrpA
MTDWTFGELPELMESSRRRADGARLSGAVDDGDSVSLKRLRYRGSRQAHRAGLLRLFMLQFREQLKYFEKNLPGLTPDGHAVHGAGFARRPAPQLVDLTFERACLVEPLADRRREPSSSRCGEAKARLGLIAGNLPPGRHRADRVAGGAEETAGLQGACGGGAGHRGATGR